MAAEPKLDLDRSEPSPLGPVNDGEESTPDAEEDPDLLAESQAAPDQPPPKRKGGRKPVRLLSAFPASVCLLIPPRYMPP